MAHFTKPLWFDIKFENSYFFLNHIYSVETDIFRFVFKNFQNYVISLRREKKNTQKMARKDGYHIKIKLINQL